MKKKFRISLYYMQEIWYRAIYLLLNTIFIFTLSYRYKQTLIYLVLPCGLTHIISTDITEIFITYLHLATLITVMLNINIFLIQSYFFLRPGLYQFETQVLTKYLISYTLGYFYFYVVLYPVLIQISWQFFFAYTLDFNAIQLIFEPKLTNYLNYIKTIIIMINIIFVILLVAAIVLNHTKTDSLTKYRKLVYMCLIVLSTSLTPPDCFSQIIIAILLIKLYEIKLFAKIINQRYKNYLV